MVKILKQPVPSYTKHSTPFVLLNGENVMHCLFQALNQDCSFLGHFILQEFIYLTYSECPVSSLVSQLHIQE